MRNSGRNGRIFVLCAQRSQHSSISHNIIWIKHIRAPLGVHCGARTIVSGQPECLSDTMGHRASQRHQHDTRRAGFLTLPSIHTEAGRRRLCYRGVTGLNGLKVELGIRPFRASQESAADKTGCVNVGFISDSELVYLSRYVCGACYVALAPVCLLTAMTWTYEKPNHRVDFVGIYLYLYL